ncbi:Flavin-binding monooxygenase-like protein [Oesophagostomum dentatum]|uniref:Flavin-containing monooxygenase n=1 Tax=Oesophagostomum dentatum TaxID=61180 RepID=A0A0B1TVJ8_OESDE|nr:Flavin-binding monooxygenase-like protein [Oesophagostomum dentatum]
MKTTVINTSKEMTAYSDFPPPKDAANFMHNTELLQYFRSYAKHFDLEKYIRFSHKVKSIKRNSRFAESGQWDVEWIDLKTNNNAVETFDGVMVCTGHHTDPYWPTPFPGQENFTGKLVHSHDYKDHKGYEDQTVVVIGIGNSGADIAVELSKISKKVYLATRSGSWVMNRVWDGGEPADLAYLSRFMFFLKSVSPWWAQNYVLERKLNKRFDHGRFGLMPKHHVLAAHVTINDELPNRIVSGTVVVIFATGFSFGFPLIEGGQLIPVKENRVDLYKYMYPAQLSPKNTLAVIGLVQPTGSIMPISEMQTRVFVAALNGPHSWPGAREAILTFEDRVFNTTRTRRTKETLSSKPPIKMLNLFRLLD